MRKSVAIWLPAALVLAAVAGCSGTGPTVPTPGGTGALQSSSAQQTSHYLWGYYTLVFDPVNETAEARPVRSAQLHVNVVKFLEGAKLYIAFANLHFDVDTIDLDVKLTHPFPGMDQYTGFDVRGIFITPGSVSGYADPDLKHSAPTESYLVNADGWTRWWNPTEFPQNGTIFAYFNGKLGNPFNGSNLNATLNGYKYFCDDLKANDTLDALIPSHRGMFRPGYTNQRHYTIHFDPTKPLIYNYAVDASWDLPNPDPPIAIPGDFPPTANCPEAYRITTTIAENDLFYLNSTNKGGHAVVEARVFDWQGCSNTVVLLDAPGTWPAVSGTLSGGTEAFSTYRFDLDGTMLNSSNPVRALLSATSLDATYTVGAPANKNVATYFLINIPVSGTAKAPIVKSIDPNHEQIGKTVSGAKVTGVNFAPNAQVSLINDANPGIVIEASAEVVTGGTLVTCNIDLSGTSVVPGKYDVRVTNPDTMLYGELDKGFTVDQTAHPWPAWRAGGPAQGSSPYVGYEGPQTAPKAWPTSGTVPAKAAASVVIANDGSVYFTYWNCGVVALNPDGSVRWTFTGLTPWICNAPCLDKEGYVYAVMGNNTQSRMYKIHPVTGTQVWSTVLSNARCNCAAPSVGLQGEIYYVTGQYGSNGQIHRVDPDGTLVWSKYLSAADQSLVFQWGIAILSDGNVVASTGVENWHNIHCFKPSGDEIWNYAIACHSTPAIGPEGNVYFTYYYGPSLIALNSSGIKLWEKPLGGNSVWASPAVDPKTGNIFVGSRTSYSGGTYTGYFYAFDKYGNQLWKNSYANTGIDSSAAVDANGDVYVALGNQDWPPPVIHRLVKLDGETGALLWQSDELNTILNGSPAIGADGKLYLPGYDAAHAVLVWGP